MIRIRGSNRNLNAVIRLPASKSISNRLLILQFLGGPGLRIKNLSHADDTLLLSSLLELLRHYHRTGSEGILRLDVRNAGTAMRFLTPLLAARRGQYLLTGSARMKQRPAGELVEALRQIGADIQYVEKEGYPPLLIKGRHLSGGMVTIDPGVSSQFISALLLMAPFLDDGLIIEMTGQPSSWPYVLMTARLLENLGARVTMEPGSIKVTGGKAFDAEICVEPDWSSASFIYSLLAQAPGGEILLEELHFTGLQGDEMVAAFFSELGVQTVDGTGGVRLAREGQPAGSFQADFSACPDLALPVIVTCSALGAASSFYGLERLRVKESDRLAVLARELVKAGVRLTRQDNSWQIQGIISGRSELVIDADSDHRVAMAFACLASSGLNIVIREPEVVNKSYPGFWTDLQSLGFDIA